MSDDAGRPPDDKRTAYWLRSGYRRSYHTDPDCDKLAGDYREGTVKEAKEAGLEPCSFCQGPPINHSHQDHSLHRALVKAGEDQDE